MRTQEIIIGKRNALISSELVIDLFPSIVYFLSESRLVLLIKYIILIERGQIDQSVLQKLKICQLLASIVHGFKNNTNIIFRLYFVNIKP